jgi:serine/threonine protein kinase
MVMQFVAGKTLQQLIPGGGLPVVDVLKYAIPIARALAAANSAGIIHRDIKPGNIMAGANGIVKVLDFGLAKLSAQEVSGEDETQALKRHTEEGTIVGTAAYMSPEQAQGKPVDAAAPSFRPMAPLLCTTGLRPSGSTSTRSRPLAVRRAWSAGTVGCRGASHPMAHAC